MSLDNPESAPALGRSPDTAGYIGALTAELAGIARANGWSHLAFTLDMAATEASSLFPDDAPAGDSAPDPSPDRSTH